MKRFAATVPVLLVVLLVFASAAATQPAPRVARVGMLCAPSCNADTNDAFLDELRKLGWVEGTTIVIERNRHFGYPLPVVDTTASIQELVRKTGVRPNWPLGRFCRSANHRHQQ